MSTHDPVRRLALRERLRSLRLARGLSQAQLGALLGVNQKRVARIEAAPDLASFGQIQQFVILLGGSIDLVDAPSAALLPSRASLLQGRGRPPAGKDLAGPQKLAGEKRGKASVHITTKEEEGQDARPGTSWSIAWD